MITCGGTEVLSLMVVGSDKPHLSGCARKRGVFGTATRYRQEPSETPENCQAVLDNWSANCTVNLAVHIKSPSVFVPLRDPPSPRRLRMLEKKNWKEVDFWVGCVKPAEEKLLAWICDKLRRGSSCDGGLQIPSSEGEEEKGGPSQPSPAGLDPRMVQLLTTLSKWPLWSFRPPNSMQGLVRWGMPPRLASRIDLRVYFGPCSALSH